MEFKEVMKQLEAMGTAQNRKVYARHGVPADKMFGVSYANLYALQKKIKVDQALADRLWASGNHDAQVLATLVADPAAMSDKQVDEWEKELDNPALTEMFIQFVSKSPLARKKADKWNKSKDELTGQAGWGLIARLALDDKELPDDYFEEYLKVIGADIHNRKNRVRYQMNGALIAIGCRNENLEKKALAVAAKVGKVEVDHGETNCKTPDATEYIRKARFRHKKIKKEPAKKATAA
ncbi:MAG: DNA alkylation repair protein [Blastocatellia bacterium]